MKRIAVLVALAAVVAACSSTTRSSGIRSAPASAPTSSAPTSSTPTTEALDPYADLSGSQKDHRLLSAARAGRTDDVALLLASGADLETRDSRERTALLLAVTRNHLGAARGLIAAGADPDALDDRHDTPWLVTGVTGSVQMAAALLRADPDLTIRNRYGGVSHIPASERGHDDYVAYVLGTTDIAVNHVNDLGWTALLEAVILGEGTDRWQNIVRSLLDHGADVSIADRNGVTALEHARRHGFVTIARMLERA